MMHFIKKKERIEIVKNIAKFEERQENIKIMIEILKEDGYDLDGIYKKLTKNEKFSDISKEEFMESYESLDLVE